MRRQTPLDVASRFLRAQVRMDLSTDYEDRTLLGDVTGYVVTPHGAVYLRVSHFNGEPWPVSPRLEAVEVLERAWPTP
jgi:hypothetical protein